MLSRPFVSPLYRLQVFLFLFLLAFGITMDLPVSAAFLPPSAQSHVAACLTNIKGTVFQDLNANGKKDPGDVGVAGVQIAVRNAVTRQLKKTGTNAEGKYQFKNLGAGKFKVVAKTPKDFTNTTPKKKTVTLPPCRKVNFGIRQNGGTPTVTGTPTNTPTPSATPTDPPVPPDPGSVAPPINQSVATNLGSSTAFLYSGSNPIQSGVAPGVIEPIHVAVLRGKVLLRDGSPIPAVKVTILDHPELGQTLTREDGMFDLAVNGGGLLTVNFAKPGYLTVQRTVDTPWQDFVHIPDVVLIPGDPNVTTIDLKANIPIQVARGSIISDARGARQQTLLFPQGTHAVITRTNGTTLTLTTLSVRSTEYTVGSTGPDAMPAELPPTSGYTYAAEMSVDEATAIHAQGPTFSPAIISYVENFLDFPVGIAVPVGSYDDKRAVWVPSRNGLVVKVLAISEDKASLDVTGSGNPATNAQLTALGITGAELKTLATLYAPGTSLWRVPLSHFSPQDENWRASAPPGAEPPPPLPPATPPPTCQDSQGGGSTIECQNQVLHETIALTGIPFALNYASNRMLGNAAGLQLVIPLSGASVPGPLDRIDVEITVAGRTHTESRPPTANQSMTFVWDAKDAYGRTVQGPQPVQVRVGYHYPSRYSNQTSATGANFGMIGTGQPLPVNSQVGFTIWRDSQYTLGKWDHRAIGLGGWSFDVHHTYNPVAKTLYRGDGSIVEVNGRKSQVLETVAGGESGGWNDLVDGMSAKGASLPSRPLSVVLAPDGSYYFSQFYGILKVSKDGRLYKVAGTGTRGFSGDGGPAKDAKVLFPQGLALGTDGSLYFADAGNARVRRIAPDGIITTFAGGGDPPDGLGDGGPASQAALWGVDDVAVAPDGSVYIADGGHGRVRRVGQDGIITTVAGKGFVDYDVCVSGGDGGPAIEAQLCDVRGVTVAPDGSLFISEVVGFVRRVGLDGIIATVAGSVQFNLDPGYWPPAGMGDGGPATKAVVFPQDVVFGPDGAWYIAAPFYSFGASLRRVAPDGIISTVRYTKSSWDYWKNNSGTPGRSYAEAGDVDVTPQGVFLIADEVNAIPRIAQVSPSLPGFSGEEVLIPSGDGSELYGFDESGRHLRTVHALTGATLYTFDYDAQGRLKSIADSNNNTTTVERDANGKPTAIVSPFGQRTTLTLDANGYLKSVTNPANETTLMEYSANGLLKSFTDPLGHTSMMLYDALGRLSRDTDAAGGMWKLDRAGNADDYSVSMTSALGRSTTYRVQNLSTGDQRQVNTLPGGMSVENVSRTDGTSTKTSANQTVTDATLQADPRWGMSAPSVNQTVRTPAGLTHVNNENRTATLSNPFDLFSLDSLTEDISVNGSDYSSTYTPSSRTWVSRSPEGRTLTSEIDAQGRLIFDQVEGLTPINYAYDDRGRLKTLTQGTGSDERKVTLDYNSAGYLASVIDPLSHTYTFKYDSAGRVTSQTLPDNRILQYKYDANGNLTSLTPPGKTAHTFEYNAIDLVSKYTPPDVNAGADETTYTYNPDRQLTLLARPDGRTIGVDYDSAGRLDTLTIARGVVDYGYNATTGNLETLNAPDGINLTFGYDGMLPTTETWSGAIAGTVTRAYDYDFRLASLELNGSAIAYEYDNDSLLKQVGDLALARDAQNGLLKGSTLGVIADTLTYNTFGELDTYRATRSGAELFKQTFTYDKLGRIATKTETLNGVTTVYGYDYDSAGWLRQVNKNNVLQSTYTYDSNGNRSGGTYDAQDRMTSYGANTYTYTANGELETKTTSGQTTRYQYDEFGNLTQVVLPNGKQIDYLVDGMDRRVGKKENGILTKRFLYESQIRPIAEFDGNGNLISRFVYATGLNVPDYMIKGGVTYRFILDHLGSPRYLVNTKNGSIAQQVNYDEFGRVIQDTNPGFQPFGFAGGLYDPETGLVRFGARDYDAGTGRWTIKDPIRFGGAEMNLYTYLAGDPVNGLDPSGLCKIEARFFRLGPGYYHAYIVTTEPGGSRKLFRAAPATALDGVWDAINTQCGNSSNQLWAISGPYNKDASDWEEGTPPSKVVLDNAASCANYDARFERILMSINQARIPYRPLTTNSNAFVRTTLERAGLIPGSPPVWAPGWDTELP